MEKVPTRVFVTILVQWLEAESYDERRRLASKFEDLVGESNEICSSKEQEEIVEDLSYEFAFYSEDSISLSGDGKLHSYSKMRSLILQSLTELGLPNK